MTQGKPAFRSGLFAARRGKQEQIPFENGNEKSQKQILRSAQNDKPW
jgi:hypothetical protein